MESFFSWLETRKGFYTSLGVIVLFNALLRLLFITYPPDIIFDEIYYRDYALDFIRGGSFYLDHPALANLPHIISLFLFGDTVIGRRGIVWLAGTLFVLGVGFLGRLLTQHYRVGIIAALLVSFESIFFVYGRIGLPEMFLLTFIVWGLVLFFLSCRSIQGGRSILMAISSGILLGLAPAVKWHGVGGLAVVAVWFVFQKLSLFIKRHRDSKGTALLPDVSIRWWLMPLAFLVVPVVVYILVFVPIIGIPNYNRSEVGDDFYSTWSCPLKRADDSTTKLPTTWFGRFFYWHCVTWNNQVYNIDRDHPHKSRWWQWPFVQKPILLYSSHNVYPPRFIWGTGNHVIWWAGALAVVGAGLMLFWKFKPIDAWLIISVLGFWLPFSFVARLTFMYSFLPVLLFQILLLAVLLDRALKKPALYPITTTYLFAVVMWFFTQYPLLTGL